MGFLDSLFRRKPPSAPQPATPQPAVAQPGPPPVEPLRLPAFLAGLTAEDAAPLTRADFEAAAARLNCEWEALAAVTEVESSPQGAFAPDGKPVICYEKHIFSRKTASRFDAAHPHVSSRTPTIYPGTQHERWAQLAEAFALDAEAALQSTAFGRFQIMGQCYAQLGHANAHEYASKLARSERDQLEAFEAFIRASGLADELQRRDWVGFASRYNGPGYAVHRMDAKLAEAYARLKSAPIA